MIFIVGIKGAAMANIALILKKMGENVMGADIDEEFITEGALRQNEIEVKVGFDVSSLPENTSRVVYSAAHRGIDNPLIKEALKRGIPVVHQAAFIDEIMHGFAVKIAVCGSHGKTTTASLLSYTLNKLNAGPSYLVGTSSFNGMWGGDYQKGKHFVLEADEYAVNPPKDKTPKLEFFHVDYILATNIDFDHPDVYESLEDITNTFEKFFQGRTLIACADDLRLLSCAKKPHCTSVTYGYAKGANLQIKSVQTSESATKFLLKYNEKNLGEFAVGLFGDKNVSNATGVILMLLQLGFEADAIREAIREFTGPKRRFEKKFFGNDTYLFDDYAHHPKEIETTINAARSRLPGRRVGVVFQPHTYSRTRALLPEFARALQGANYALIAPIFPSARENPAQFDVSAADIASVSRSGHVIACDTKDALLKHLRSRMRTGDVIITMGAGDIYKMENDIIEVIRTI